jgi:hypothetical protein
MLLTSKIGIKIVPTNINNFKKHYPQIKLYDSIEVNVDELSNNSIVLIKCKCDICQETKKLQYRKYLKNIRIYDYYSCKKCKNLKTSITKKSLYGDPNYNNSKKMILTKENMGLYIPASQVDDFRRYRKIVNRFTYKSKKTLYKNWNGLDFYDSENILDNLNLLSKNMQYPTVDHKISIKKGFVRNIPPYLIGSIDNLCITKRITNLLKRDRDI